MSREITKNDIDKYLNFSMQGLKKNTKLFSIIIKKGIK